MVSQIQTGSLSSWIKNKGNSAKLLKDSYYQLDSLPPEAQKAPFISITKNGDTKPLFQLRLHEIVVDGPDKIYISVDVPDKFATKKFLFKFAGDGKTMSEKADSFSCDTLLRGMVLDKEGLPQAGFPNIVLQMRAWPLGVDKNTPLEGWRLPEEMNEGASAYVEAFKQACDVSFPLGNALFVPFHFSLTLLLCSVRQHGEVESNQW